MKKNKEIEMIHMHKTKETKVPVPFERSLYLLHPFCASLVTSKGRSGKINVMAVAWIIPVSVNPPMVAMSIRPERYSHDLIIEAEEFVVNVPTFEMARKVLFCGRQSGKSHDKFKKASLSPREGKKVNTPIIKECVAHLECNLAKTMEIGDHTLIIGRVVAAYALDSHFGEVYNMTKFRPCLHLGKNFFTTCIKESVEPEIQPTHT